MSAALWSGRLMFRRRSASASMVPKRRDNSAMYGASSRIDAGVLSYVIESPGPRYRYPSARSVIDFPAIRFVNGHRKYGRCRFDSHEFLSGAIDGTDQSFNRASSTWPRGTAMNAPKPSCVTTTYVRPG